MPIITLEVMSDSTAEHIQSAPTETADNLLESIHTTNTGLHFLTEKKDKPTLDNSSKVTPRARNDLLEYLMRDDGSVVCKLCGEVLQSRTHWYRHKYKLHVVQPLHPAPLFQCEQCLVYFKSRKGYIGHLASRHGEVISDTSPVLSSSQAEAIVKEVQSTTLSPPEEKEHPDPEMSIPKSSVPNHQSTVVNQLPAKLTEVKGASKERRDSSSSSSNQAEIDEKRSREEKLVADIIDRVRRECEAQGTGGSTRRGYSRRYTVMHT